MNTWTMSHMQWLNKLCNGLYLIAGGGGGGDSSCSTGSFLMVPSLPWRTIFCGWGCCNCCCCCCLVALGARVTLFFAARLIRSSSRDKSLSEIYKCTIFYLYERDNTQSQVIREHKPNENYLWRFVIMVDSL